MCVVYLSVLAGSWFHLYHPLIVWGISEDLKSWNSLETVGMVVEFDEII